MKWHLAAATGGLLAWWVHRNAGPRIGQSLGRLTGPAPAPRARRPTLPPLAPPTATETFAAQMRRTR